MPFFDEKSGALTFDEGLRLIPHMEKEALLAALKKARGASPDLGASGIVAFPACRARGGLLAPICTLKEGRLSAVSLVVQAVSQGRAPTAAEQRGFLFLLLCLKDPCPDTLRNCVFKAEGATVSISTDPRLGGALARIQYR